MTELDPRLITQCGVLTATTRGGPDYLSVVDEIQVKHSADTRTLTTDAAHADFPKPRFRPDETILHQPALGGNGRGAQAADAVGQLTARLALTGQWQSGLPAAPSGASSPTAPGTA